MSPDTVGLALLLLGVLLLISKLVRVRWKLTQKLYLPSSIIGGGIALLLGPDLFGRAMGLLADRGIAEGFAERAAEGGLFGVDIMSVWASLPGLLISVVFASLFLGKRMPKMREAIDLAGPNLSFGITVASGQYVIGLLLALLVLAPFFGVPVISGALIEIGFLGGHGTAAGLGDTFEQVGWAEGQDLALGMATIGLLSGVIIGIILINWGARRGKTSVISSDNKGSDLEQAGLVQREKRTAGSMMTIHPSSMDPLTLHFGLVALAVIIGQLILSALQWVEQLVWADTIEIMAYVPLFPLAMIGGIIVQLFIDRFDRNDIVDEQSVERIQGLSLDVLVIAAMATLSLQAIADNIAAFAVLSIAGILWCLFAFLFLAPRIMPNYWFERGIGEFGQSLGVTATGMVLMRVVDPEVRTPAYPAFGYKQLVFEPFFGGGLVTAAAIPLIVSPLVGPWGFLAIMAATMLASLFFGLVVLRRRRRKEEQRAERGQEQVPVA
ncbi:MULTISPECIES: sodium/glutamate symporter [unclassified Nocardiopsis]|jgi:glutamate:Na+ symporter, ESS family|uniref:sodium/glutamate symporter n=1 Tax=unclassified Nocardiopsis TaxID=2649073 RepID=UPI00066C83EB|nr:MULTISPECIES: sodium:glutamate symporter [unclassified Nocardiopsis]MBQ1080856.1 sodium:glutamate symporter [Nocardiopsis sp. B62]